MTIVYDKLWHRLAEKGLRKKDLREAAGISRASIAKLGKNEIVTTEVLAKICTALSCDISEIAERHTGRTCQGRQTFAKLLPMTYQTPKCGAADFPAKIYRWPEVQPHGWGWAVAVPGFFSNMQI